jgi:hypothetical protein
MWYVRCIWTEANSLQLCEINKISSAGKSSSPVVEPINLILEPHCNSGVDQLVVDTTYFLITILVCFVKLIKMLEVMKGTIYYYDDESMERRHSLSIVHHWEAGLWQEPLYLQAIAQQTFEFFICNLQFANNYWSCDMEIERCNWKRRKGKYLHLFSTIATRKKHFLRLF